MNVANFLVIPALIMGDEIGFVFGDERRTFANVADRAARRAAELREAGIGRGDVVAILDTSSVDYVEALHALAFVGAVAVPLNYRAKAHELEEMLRAAGATVVLAGGRYANLARQLGRRSRPLAHAVADDMAPLSEPADVSDADAAVILFTSGTTARPKSIRIAHGQLCAYVESSMAPASGAIAGVALLAAPLYHVAGLTTAFTAPYGGRRLVVMAQFDAAAWLERVQDERVTHAFVVPTMLRQIVDEPGFATESLTSLQLLSYGAGPMPPSLIEGAIERFPAATSFANGYGQTETTSTVTMLVPEDHRLTGTPDAVAKKRRRLASVGRPLAGVELRIVDGEHHAVAAGAVGEVAVRTPRSSGRDDQGWHYTGDLGWLDEDGYLFLAGRKGDLIVRGGENISPVEVERVLQDHPAVRDVAVVGVPDEEWGERVAAAIVLREGHSIDQGELKTFCRERLASYKRPELLRVVPELPRTATGKVLRREVRLLFAS